MDPKIQRLKKILDESAYTLALCGTGLMDEGGLKSLKTPERSYGIEDKYGASPEEIYTEGCLNTNAERFFEFYRNEILASELHNTVSGSALASMEQAGRLQCLVTTNIYDLPRKAGIRNYINLHGCIYENHCVRCGKSYPMEYIKQSVKVPVCQECKGVVRPNVALFHAMIDSAVMSRVTQEAAKADVLLLLGTSLHSEVYRNYTRYFKGRYIVIIHREKKLYDEQAELVICDDPQNILTQLGYGEDSQS